MKILAAVVTHNRCDLLKRCLSYIDSQSRKPDGLLVINNASTDGTAEMLINRGTHFVTQENLGSAGGWRRCIQEAINGGFDAVWLMDDDGFPASSALATLEQALTPGVACASSVVVREDCVDKFVFPFPVLDKSELPIIYGWPRKIAVLSKLRDRAQHGVYPFAHFFNGALLSLAAVRQVGNVNQEFFIYGEEVDYFFRLRAHGPIISVLDALHFHPDVSQRPYNPLKVYYYIKNSLILNRLHYDYVALRNVFMVGLIFYRLLKRNGFLFALSLAIGRNAPILYRSISQGLAGRLGRDFRG